MAELETPHGTISLSETILGTVSMLVNVHTWAWNRRAPDLGITDASSPEDCARALLTIALEEVDS